MFVLKGRGDNFQYDVIYDDPCKFKVIYAYIPTRVCIGDQAALYICWPFKLLDDVVARIGVRRPYAACSQFTCITEANEVWEIFYEL